MADEPADGTGLSPEGMSGDDPATGGLAIAECQDAEAALSEAEDRRRRKQAEHESRAVTRLNESVLATLPSWLFVLDGALRVLQVSPSYLQAARRSPADVVGRDVAEALPPSLLAAESLRDRIRTVAATGTRDEVLGLRVAESPRQDRYFDARICGIQPTPGEPDRGAPRVLLVLDDVTRHRTLEEQMHRADRLESLGKLAGGIAHDLNNLLTGLMGFAHLGLSEVPKGSAMESYLTQILQLGERGAALTRQILTFSRRQTLAPSIFDLNDLLRQSLTMLQQLIGEDVELQFLPAGDLGTVRADPGQIEQVLTNLVVNARDAMPRGGKLTIETANADFDGAYAAEHLGAVPGPHVLLSVTDTGCGMDPATLARIFDPFFTTKEEGQGTGLGLATVYGIVKKHGGNVWAYSEPGRGATFKVYLPRVGAVREPPLQAAGRRAAPSRGTETLLVVEDQAPVRQVVTRYLEALGYGVIAASTPHEAEEQFAQRGQGVALLLTDVVLPERTGGQLYERLSASCPGLRVLYMSGYTDTAVNRSDNLLQGAAFLQKPFTPTELAAKVREVLDA